MARPEPKVVCKHCGSDRIDVRFTTSGRGSAILGVQRGGEVYVDSVEDRDFDTFSYDYDEFICRGCGRTAWKAEQLVQATPAGPEHLQPGDVVFLPDGLKGTVATVDYDAVTFTVEGWHETFDFHEAQVAEPLTFIARAA